jgi:hypothetical protein
MKNFPKYYFFGSDDSTDCDVVIEVEEISKNKEESTQYIKSLNKEFNLNWNMNLVVIEDGIIVDTIKNKSTIDSLNNALFHTYKFHVQKYPKPIKKSVKRNKLLALYRCVRTILTNCTRVDKIYRSNIMPVKGIHPWFNKIKSLEFINFKDIDTFKQKYQNDIDTWKILAFYLGQFVSLNEDIEIYSKKDLIKYHPSLYNFIYRKEINDIDKEILQNYKNKLLNIIYEMDFINEKSNGFYSILECNGEIIDMYNEIIIK